MRRLLERLGILRPRPPAETFVVVGEDDPVAVELLRRVWQTGNAFVARRNDDGTAEFEEWTGT